MVDVEADLRRKLAESARTFVVLLQRGLVATPDLALRQLADRAFGSVERLQDAAAMLDNERDGEAKALLVRAARLAANPSPAAPAMVRERPDASRFSSGGHPEG